MTQLLTKDDVQHIWELSKQHADNVIENNNGVYTNLLDVIEDKLDADPETAKNVCDETADIIRSNRKQKLQRVLESKMYKTGWKNKDPYFLLCLKPVSPLIYGVFLQDGITTYYLKNKNEWDANAINTRFEDLAGNYFTMWLKSFGHRYHEYYNDMDDEVMQKLGREEVPGRTMWRGLSLSNIVDYLGKMRKAAKRLGHM